MRRPRVIHPGAAPGVHLVLEPVDQHHLGDVLRLRPGAAVEVLTGAGASFVATYLGPEPPQLLVTAEPLSQPALPPLRVGIGILRGARMDWMIEKLSELGVAAVVPLLAARCNAQPRLERWRRIARESAKQCGRSRLLEVEPPVALAEFAAHVRGQLTLVLEPGGEALGAHAEAIRAAPEVVLVVGPEGGFSDTERRALAGLPRLRLGPTTLRAETAAIAAASAVIVTRDGVP